MPDCYQCRSPIPRGQGVPLLVLTGRSQTSLFSIIFEKRRLAIRNHYGFRLVCSRCVRKQQRQRTQLRVAVGLVIVYFVVATLGSGNHQTTSTSSETTATTKTVGSNYPSDINRRETASEPASPQNIAQSFVVRPEVPKQETTLLDTCDQVAANPNDLRRVGSGVPYDQLKTHAKEAADACAAAIAANPKELRFHYQLARALEFTNRPKAFEIHNRLVKLQYPAAYDNLGWMFFYDQKAPPQAANYFRLGANLGDPDSMVSLADMIDRGVFVPPNAYYTKWSLLKRASELGHQAANQAYNAEITRQQQLKEHPFNEEEMRRRVLDTFETVLRNPRP
jgi:hypothetical protein